MMNESEVVADIQRGADKRQQPEQEFFVKVFGVRRITLKFVDNFFRRHFAMPSKKEKATDPETKIKRKAVSRFLVSSGKTNNALLASELQDPDFQKKVGATGPTEMSTARAALRGRYSTATKNNQVIDLTTTNLHRVLEHLAKELDSKTKHTWKSSQTLTLDFTFPESCVVKTKLEVAGSDGDEHANIDVERGNTIRIELKWTAQDVFEFWHVK